MRKINLEQYKEKVRKLYLKDNLSLKKVAEEIGVSAGKIRKEMVLWNIQRRATRKRLIKKPAKQKLEEIYINKKLTMDKIAKEFGVSTSTIFRWFKEDNIPVRKFKYPKSNFSGNPKERAYILGLVNGDIHARKHYRQILAELTTTHPAMSDLFNSVFQNYGTIKKYLKYNRIIKRYEWQLYVLLNDSFKFMLSKDKNIDNKYFYDFLAGFFDCEGCLFIYNNKSYVGLSFLIYNCNKRLLEIIKKRLEREGFDVKLSKFFKQGQKTTNNYYRRNDLWVVRLHTRKEVLSLINKMPIKHKEKIDKLKIATSSINKKWPEISDQVTNLRICIKQEVNEFIKPKEEQNERSIVL